MNPILKALLKFCTTKNLVNIVLFHEIISGKRYFAESKHNFAGVFHKWQFIISLKVYLTYSKVPGLNYIETISTKLCLKNDVTVCNYDVINST